MNNRGNPPSTSDAPESAAEAPLVPGEIGRTLSAWLADHRGSAQPLPDLLNELCERLSAAKVPLFRVMLSMPTLHPELFVRAVVWVRGQGAGEQGRQHGIQDSAAYLQSPVAPIHRGAAMIRRRLEGADAIMDFPILHELRAQGITDYYILPLVFSRGLRGYISWATDQPGGFDDRDLALLGSVIPVVALRVEVEAVNRMLSDLMTTYLGQDAARKVLAGTIRRGQGERIRAAIWFCDLRGFTAMADSMEPQELIKLLDDYFDCMAGPVQDQGGEILKFVGDGLLAIFRIEGDGEAEMKACRCALNAAIDGLERLHELNQIRALGGGKILKAGIGLHLGEVVYGNIGARDRLDFTVIGRAVNEVTRIEGACAALGRVLLASGAFVRGGCEFTDCRQPLVSVGFHRLRGVREPQELFGLENDRPEA